MMISKTLGESDIASISESLSKYILGDGGKLGLDSCSLLSPLPDRLSFWDWWGDWSVQTLSKYFHSRAAGMTWSHCRGSGWTPCWASPPGSWGQIKTRKCFGLQGKILKYLFGISKSKSPSKCTHLSKLHWYSDMKSKTANIYPLRMNWNNFRNLSKEGNVCWITTTFGPYEGKNLNWKIT